MHRKSAYLLFLAVFGLLVIGIVMLFSTSEYARDRLRNDYFWICSSACNPQPANCACAGRSRLGNNGFDWNSGVCDNVRCRDKSFVAWCGVARCFGVSSTCCNPNLRTNGATLRVSSPAEFQRRCWFATDAGVDRLGQRRNGRAWLGQRSTEDALSALCAYRFYFSNCW